MEGNIDRIKELVNELKNIIDEIEKQQPIKSEVGKTFQQKMKELEKKNALAIEKII